MILFRMTEDDHATYYIFMNDPNHTLSQLLASIAISPH